MSDQSNNPLFLDVEQALTEPEGLLAVGGDLSPERLLEAYRRGIFPWYSEDQPVLWWSPNPRSVLFPDKLKISRSLKKTLNKNIYTVTLDTAFRDVMVACAQPRKDGNGTWITPDMIDAYCTLFEQGHAHSVETWLNDELVGGLYGIAIGKVFFGESMFSKKTDASKVAFTKLVQQLKAWGFELIDCQIQSVHLDSLGAENIPRRHFTDLLGQYCQLPATCSPWQFDDKS